MLVLTIKMELDNAAFADDGTAEVERILGDVASRLPEPLDETGQDLSLHDANGNWCGFARIRNAKRAVR